MSNTEINDSPLLFSCHLCDKSYSQKCSLSRHMKIHHSSKPQHACPICAKNFTRVDSLAIHIKIHNRPTKSLTPKRHQCSICKKEFTQRNNLSRHKKIHFQPPKEPNPPKKIVQKSSTSTTQAIKPEPPRSQHASNLAPCLGTFQTFIFHPIEATSQDLHVFLESIKLDLIKKIKEVANFHQGVKWYITTCVKMIRMISETEEDTCLPHFRSNCITTPREEDPDVQSAINKTLTSLEEFEGLGSGWVIDKIQYLELKTAAYQPFKDNYSSPLLKVMANARSVF